MRNILLFITILFYSCGPSAQDIAKELKLIEKDEQKKENQKEDSVMFYNLQSASDSSAEEMLRQSAEENNQ